MSLKLFNPQARTLDATLPRYTATQAGDVIEAATDGTLAEFVAQLCADWRLEDEDVIVWDGRRVAALVRPGQARNRVTWFARQGRPGA